MAVLTDVWDDITGKTAMEEAARRAEEDRLRMENNQAKQRTFADTEGKGKGSIGQVSLGLEDEELEDELDPTANLYL